MAFFILISVLHTHIKIQMKNWSWSLEEFFQFTRHFFMIKKKIHFFLQYFYVIGNHKQTVLTSLPKSNVSNVPKSIKLKHSFMLENTFSVISYKY